LAALNLATQHSADPLPRKQALAIAEALLEEVALMPFTDCDPDSYEPVAKTCTQGETMGPETGEARGSLTTPFDNVNDYNNFNLAGGGSDIGGMVTVPAGYSATVAVAQDAAFGPAGSPLPAADALRIAVTVAYNNGNDSLTLAGYRTRYEPNP
jgi:MSHA pilin protein MshD